ncbi:kinase-like domain-containing protein [Glomus cerebriforme]|uniref:Kinase-like domain-containing protein n=1 Tax=Glomus cerebriforme TaxID=658196 RepID=A0A397S678_9GLOM|nr:kinase-like domain-containing protein [Glomus cerebriforme]
MSDIRQKLVNDAFDRSSALIDYNHNDKNKSKILADESLTKDEKSETIRLLNEVYDYNKVRYNKGTKRICENCQEECLATLYCEFCIRNYLKTKFSDWTSENNDIDNLIQKCQMESFIPYKIIEWVPYENFQNINYLTRGCYSEIYSADWIDGSYNEWNSKEKQLKRLGTHEVILKKLGNVERANGTWFEETKSHLTLSSKWPTLVQVNGLTQDLSNGNFMLVMSKMDIDLKNYLQQNHNQITWKERINIVSCIIDALSDIHKENAVHRNLHSGNILYSKYTNQWYISDLGFCGPADKPLNSIYGNLAYIAPEILTKKKYTFASDIYSIAMLMWEISSGQPPFINYEHNYDLATNIFNGMRPRIVLGTPLEYKELMKQCWDADPTKRPHINALFSKIGEINELYNQNENNENQTNNNTINYNSQFNSLSKSKFHNFKNLPEPKNASEEDQEVYDFNKSYNQNENIENHSGSSKIYYFKSFPKPKNFAEENNEEKNKSKRIYSSISNENDQKEDLNNKTKKIKQNESKDIQIYITSEDEEMYINPNLHPEDQDKLEIPEGNI